jgi:hypothetical protein
MTARARPWRAIPTSPIAGTVGGQLSHPMLLLTVHGLPQRGRAKASAARCLFSARMALRQARPGLNPFAPRLRVPGPRAPPSLGDAVAQQYTPTELPNCCTAERLAPAPPGMIGRLPPGHASAWAADPHRLSPAK